MGKKKGKVDKIHHKKRNAEVKKINPFEIKVNKQKHHVLGRKLSKHEIGLPGHSRSKSVKKRKETLLPEYEQRFKSSKFVDKRIGENDANLSYEEKMTKRLVLEKQKYLEKRSIFSLNDDEELTHYGQTLSEIETFDNPIDSDDEEIDGRISGKLVAEEHFGGGILEKQDKDEERKPWKERMEELIIKTRKEKFELQKERETAIKLTEQVDSDWKTLRYLMSGSTLKDVNERKSMKSKIDDYDMNVRALGLEARAMATDKMKSEKELAKEEMERLEKLEKERLLRMKAPWEAEKKKNRKYMSADALGDEQFLTPILKEKSKKGGKKKSVKFEGDSEDEQNEDEDEEEKDEDDEDEEGNEEDGENDNEETEESDAESVEDSYSDVLTDEEDDNGKTEEPETSEDEKEASEDEKENKTKQKEERLAAISEEAKKQLPFTFEAPTTFSTFLSQLDGYSSDDQITIIERTQKCTHPSLAEGNKKKLEKLFSFVLDYFCELCNKPNSDLWLLDRLTIQLFQLTKVSPKSAAQTVLAKIKEKQSNFNKTYPDMDTLMLLKLVPILFPASDFQHLVCTPAMLFMGQILSQSLVKSGRDVAAGLFLCSVFLQCVTISKRFVPEVMNYLHGILYLASSKDSQKSPQIFPPFKPVEPENNLLVLSEETASEETIQPLKLSYLKGCKDDDDKDDLFNCDRFRLSAIHVAAGLSIEFCALYKDLPSCPEIFSPVEVQLSHLTKDRYPKVLQERLSKLENQIEEIKHIGRFPLVQIVKQKITNLKMFEPRIEEVSDHRRKKTPGSSAEGNERQKLLYKIKKEMKGAIQEIKKDAQFLARHQRQEQMTKDSVRKRKVKEIYSQMESQEAEFQEMKRMKEKQSK